MSDDVELAWQPMETAPKDGSLIIVYWELGNFYHARIASWSAKLLCWSAPPLPLSIRALYNECSEDSGLHHEFFREHLKDKMAPLGWMPFPNPGSNQ